MDDTEDDARYPPKSYSLNRQRHPVYSRQNYSYQPQEDEEFDEENEDVEDEMEDDADDPDVYYRGYKQSERFERYPKRQKLRKSVSGYQFAVDSVKLANDWGENEVYVLLEVWGDRFLQLGRRSLRNEDWVDVSEKVSDVLKSDKTESQCRQMVDALKRKFKKEKLKVDKSGGNLSKWVFFRKMEMLMGLGSSSFRQQESGLACGVDSGEFVFMNTEVYLDRSNGFDEMRDSPAGSEMDEDEEEEEGGSSIRRDGNDETSLRMLADSVQRFGRIYEKIESSKKEQMKELEKMRLDFQRELELQKKHILERAEAEIAKIREEEDDEETDEVDEDYEDDDDEDDDDDDDGDNDNDEASTDNHSE
ncbi:hypothetical protein SLE2022_266800 [Rubroshorea leprosula]